MTQTEAVAQGLRIINPRIRRQDVLDTVHAKMDDDIEEPPFIQFFVGGRKGEVELAVDPRFAAAQEEAEMEQRYAEEYE